MVAALALLDDVRTELNLYVWLFTYARKGPKPRARRTHENVIVAAVAVAPAAAGWSNEKNKSEIKILCVFFGGEWVFRSLVKSCTFQDSPTNKTGHLCKACILIQQVVRALSRP